MRAKTALEYPTTVTEWEAYAATLNGGDLRSKALAINTISFVRTLEDEGFGPSDITSIYLAFARAFAADGQEPPGRVSGGYINYGNLLDGLTVANLEGVAVGGLL